MIESLREVNFQAAFWSARTMHPPVFRVCVLALGVFASTQPAATQGQQVPNRYDDAQIQANQILNQSLGSINSCYHGAHQWFRDDVLGRAMDALLKKAAEPGGLCDLYLQKKLPFEISITVVPGVTVPGDRVCALLQHPACPAP